MAACLVLAMGACGTGGTNEVPEATIVALVNASAPPDDLISSQFCGGVVVGPDLVVTAAHCLTGKLPEQVVAVVGADNLCRTAPIEGERRPVLGISVSGERDVALLTLRPSSEGQAPAVADVEEVGDGESLLALGWGPESVRGPTPCRVAEKQLQEVPLSECASLIPPGTEAPREAFFCAVGRPNSSNTCVGDSGGPVFDPTTGGLVGVVLSGTGCLPTDPGLYARASNIPLPPAWTDD